MATSFEQNRARLEWSNFVSNGDCRGLDEAGETAFRGFRQQEAASNLARWTAACKHAVAMHRRLQDATMACNDRDDPNVDPFSVIKARSYASSQARETSSAEHNALVVAQLLVGCKFEAESEGAWVTGCVRDGGLVWNRVDLDIDGGSEHEASVLRAVPPHRLRGCQQRFQHRGGGMSRGMRHGISPIHGAKYGYELAANVLHVALHAMTSYLAFSHSTVYGTVHSMMHDLCLGMLQAAKRRYRSEANTRSPMRTMPSADL